LGLAVETVTKLAARLERVKADDAAAFKDAVSAGRSAPKPQIRSREMLEAEIAEAAWPPDHKPPSWGPPPERVVMGPAVPAPSSGS
jgi:hypothetical protein